MITVNRLMPNICSDNLQESKSFYTDLFNFSINYDSDWFIHLVSHNRHVELGIVDRTNAIVPKEYQQLPQGFYLTLVVESADDVFEKAKELNVEIIEKPTDTFYGQRRLLIKDPSGTLVDVSSPIPNFQF